MFSILLILSQIIVIDCIVVVLLAIHVKCDRVLRIMFVSKKLEVKEGRKKQRNEGLHSLYLSSDMVLGTSSEMMILTGYVAHMEKMRTAYRILLRKAVGERPPGALAYEDTMFMCISYASPLLTFIVRPLIPNVAADGQSYFYFKCPCLHPHRTLLFLLAVKSSV